MDCEGREKHTGPPSRPGVPGKPRSPFSPCGPGYDVNPCGAGRPTIRERESEMMYLNMFGSFIYIPGSPLAPGAP